jgi:copper ion binding protein
MKSLLTLAVLLGLAMAFALSWRPSKPDPWQAILRVEGMTCPRCASSIQASLSQVKGVQKVFVSLEDAQAMVGFNSSQTPIQPLIQAVEQAGGTRHVFRAVLLLNLDGVKDKAAADKVQSALKKVEGVRDVAVSVEKKEATVEFDPKGYSTMKQLVDSIQTAGYKVRFAPTEKKKAVAPRIPCCP